MGNLIMPKQTAKLDRFYYSLEIFYTAYNRNEPNVSNADFKQQITSRFEELRNSNDGAMIVKQSEITRYFGMAYHSYTDNTTTITDRGIAMYEAYLNNDSHRCIDLVVESIANDPFGRNNSAFKSGDSDVDPPKLFTRAILDLDGISRNDFSFLLYFTHDIQLSYEDACVELNHVRFSSNDSSVIIAPEKLNKYGDPKFSVFLTNIGYCELDEEKKYRLSPYVISKHEDRLKKISIYNRLPEIIHFSNPPMFLDAFNHTRDIDCNNAYKEKVSQTIAYNMESSTFKRQNNRVPAESSVNKSNRRYPTDTRIAKTALMLANYKCEHDPNHITFISKTDTPFMEAHHLVPMTAQSDFLINLDRVENIVSLCPNCHSAIHYGNNSERKTILTKLFNKHCSQLKAVGINIDLDLLFGKYYP